MHDRVFDASKAVRLDDPKRHALLQVGRLLERVGPLDGQVWADIGAGTGFYTLYLARAVGERGRVHAVDLQEKMLELLRERASAQGATNVETFRGSAEELPLPDDSVDGLLCGNTFHELDDRGAVLAQARRVLRREGRLLVVDWLHPDDSTEPLPEMGPPTHHRLLLDTIRSELGAAGLEPEILLGLIPGHYVALARKR